MKTKSTLRGLLAITSCLWLLDAGAVQDDGDRPVAPPNDPPALEDLQRLVGDAMPPDVKDDNSELFARLLKPRVSQRGPSEAFNAQTMSAALRLRRAVPSKGCFAPAPNLDCVLTEGTREGGGAFKKIAADSFGNVSFLSRLPDPSRGDPESLPAVQLPTFSMSDEEAQKQFFDIFVQVFGVPPEEAPDPASVQVERLQLGIQDAAKPTAPPELHEVAGVMTVPRLLLVEGLAEPLVPVLGAHVQGAMDDLGRGLPFRVEVQGWTRFSLPDALQRARAMSKSELVNEIARTLSPALREKPKSIGIRIAYAKVGDFDELGSYGGPDTDEGSAAAAQVGMPDSQRYVPVLITSISPLSADASEEEQAGAFSSAGQEIVTPLFALSE